MQYVFQPIFVYLLTLFPHICSILHCEDLCRQGGQHAQGECKGGEAAEESRLLFHGNSLFLLLFLVNTT